MTRQLTVRLSDETYDALVKLAEHEDRAPAVVVRLLVEAGVAAEPDWVAQVRRQWFPHPGTSTGDHEPKGEEVPVSAPVALPTSTIEPKVVTLNGGLSVVKPAAPSATHLPCGHSKVLLRGGLCRGCNPMVPG